MTKRRWEGPRQKDYPKDIIVGDSVYLVRFVRAIGGEPAGSDKETLGLCCPGEKEILLKQGMTPRERMSTFIHELLHAIEFEYEIDIPHKLVYQLEGPLTQLVLDNQP
ncbi:hypothetical protein EBX31_07265 [bacterium]|nr:hypothetical protein [bacterium]